MRFAVYLASCATLFAANQAADIESIIEVPIELHADTQVETQSNAYLQLSAEAIAEADAYIQAEN